MHLDEGMDQKKATQDKLASGSCKSSKLATQGTKLSQATSLLSSNSSNYVLLVVMYFHDVVRLPM